MQEFIVPYISFLSGDCRYSPHRVSSYVDTFRDLIEKLNIRNAYQIDVAKVKQACRMDRWETTSHGIQAVELQQGSYAQALRLFIEYLQEVGYPLQDGISDAIKTVDRGPEEIAGLNEQEIDQIKRYLVFNIDKDCNRRDTALLFLMMSVPLTLDQILSLRVGDEGIIAENGVAGHFHSDNGQLTINFRGLLYPVSDEAATFISFYLENRTIKNNPNLFIRGTGKTGDQPLTRTIAKKAVLKICSEAAVMIKPELLEPVFAKTAVLASEQTARKSRNEDLRERQIEIVVSQDRFAAQAFSNQNAA